MAITPFVFNPATGWEDSSVFPTTRNNEELVRGDLQRLHDQTRDYINNTLAPQVEGALADQKTELEAEIAEISQGAVPDNTITAAKLTADSVTTAKIADGAVTTPKIADEAVTKAKLAETLADEIDGKLDAPIGTIIQSVRTDLGDKWALCNGDFNDLADPTEKAALDAVLKKNDIPKPNPTGASITGPVYEMYNGEWVSWYSSNIVVFTADGAEKYRVAASSLPGWVSGSKVLGVEHNGTKYVIFTASAEKTMSVCQTADFSTYTTPLAITTSEQIYRTGYSYYTRLIYDGNHYYLKGDAYPAYSGASYNYQWVLVFKETVGVISELSAKKQQLLTSSSNIGNISVCYDGTSHIVFMSQDDSDQNYSAALSYFDSSATKHSISTIRSAGRVTTVNVFNDTYLIAWGYGQYTQLRGVFIKRSDMTVAGNFSESSNNGAFGYMAADGASFRYYYYTSSSGYPLYYKSTPTSSATPWSGWTTTSMNMMYDASPFYAQAFADTHPRSSGSTLPRNAMLLRAKLLPLLPSDECYSYIKVKE